MLGRNFTSLVGNSRREEKQAGCAELVLLSPLSPATLHRVSPFSTLGNTTLNSPIRAWRRVQRSQRKQSRSDRIPLCLTVPQPRWATQPRSRCAMMQISIRSIRVRPTGVTFMRVSRRHSNSRIRRPRRSHRQAPPALRPVRFSNHRRCGSHLSSLVHPRRRTDQRQCERHAPVRISIRARRASRSSSPLSVARSISHTVFVRVSRSCYISSSCCARRSR